MDVIAAQNMDYVSEVKEKVQQAIETGLQLLKIGKSLLKKNRKGVKKYVDIYLFGKRKIRIDRKTKTNPSS